MKITIKRQKILDTLKKHHGVISARDLTTRLSEIDQATVYRNLDLFVREGLVKKFVFDGSESIYEYAYTDHHHAVCDDCEKILHFNVSDKRIIDSLNIDNFDISTVEIVVRGRCKK